LPRYVAPNPDRPRKSQVGIEACQPDLNIRLLWGLGKEKMEAPMNVLKPAKKLAVLSALVEGNSIRSVSRMTGVHKTTILKLLVQVGERCQALMDATLRGLSPRSLQVDEIWTFVWKKQRRVTFEERFDPEIGDQYVFYAIDAETKLVPHFDVGKRNMVTAYRFMEGLRGRMNGHRFQLTTDGFVPYIGAVEMAWGADAPDFAQLIKLFGSVNPGPSRYSPARIIDAVPTVIHGTPNPRLVSTSYIERANLSLRMACRRFTRLTNAFSKKLDNLKAAVALFFAYYNFCRIHGSLRITPAMAAGVTDRVWSLEELLF